MSKKNMLIFFFFILCSCDSGQSSSIDSSSTNDSSFIASSSEEKTFEIFLEEVFPYAFTTIDSPYIYNYVLVSNEPLESVGSFNFASDLDVKEYTSIEITDSFELDGYYGSILTTTFPYNTTNYTYSKLSLAYNEHDVLFEFPTVSVNSQGSMTTYKDWYDFDIYVYNGFRDIYVNKNYDMDYHITSHSWMNTVIKNEFKDFLLDDIIDDTITTYLSGYVFNVNDIYISQSSLFYFQITAYDNQSTSTNGIFGEYLNYHNEVVIDAVSTINMNCFISGVFS